MAATASSNQVTVLVDILLRNGGMMEFAVAIALVAGSVGAVFAGVAMIRFADAWRIWAKRCDPKNPNFRAPTPWMKP